MNLTCKEWDELCVRTNGLTAAEARRLYSLATRSSRRLKLPRNAVLTRTHQGLKAGQVVGIIATPGCTLEILPKIDGEDGAVRTALIRMLAVAWDLRVADGDLAPMQTQQHNLLELLIRLFADRLLVAVQRGIPRRYLSREDDLKLLRGRLNITRQLTHFAARRDRIACRFDELSDDTPLNRVLKAAVQRLAKLTRSADNARRLADLATRFEYVSDVSDPLRESVRLDRTNTAYREIYALARLFVSGQWQGTAGGRGAGFALLFAMNDLFEVFIGRCLKRAVGPSLVSLQDRRYSALTDAADRSLFNLRPDAVIKAPVAPIILDTKWKRLTPRDPSSEFTLGVAQSDVYQMLAYAHAYDASRLVLLYPWHGDTGKPDGVCHEWTISGTKRRLDVATVDIGRPHTVIETLRGIVSLG